MNSISDIILYGTNRKVDIKIPLEIILLCISSGPNMIFTFINCKFKTIEHLYCTTFSTLSLFIIRLNQIRMVLEFQSVAN